MMEDFIKGIKLDKNVPIPLYYQLKKCVLRMLEEADLKEGDMLPPESELCEALGVSRPTIRQAFNELVAEGHLSRFKGRGTFVSKPKVEEGFLHQLTTFNNEMRAKNMTPRTQVLALETISDPHDAHERLGLEIGAPLIHLSRLRFADGVPLVFVETYLSYAHYPRLMDMDFCEKSLYDSLEAIYGVYISHVRREMEAVNSRRNEAELLKIAARKAISLVKTVGFTETMPNPIEFSVARYRGDLNKFTLDIFRQR